MIKETVYCFYPAEHLTFNSFFVFVTSDGKFNGKKISSHKLFHLT